MGSTIRLEIQNRTPFPLTWAHLVRRDDPPGRAYANLLAQGIPARRGRVIGDVEAGPARLVCGFTRDAEGGRERCESEPHDLAADGAASACVVYDQEEDAFRVRWLDAASRNDDPDRPPAGRYRWQGRRGQPRFKRTETQRRADR